MSVTINQPVKKIELLAPARDAQTGKAAIIYGADAVYIGAPKFGARHGAGNELGEIASLIEFAHAFHARVYVVVNTIIYEQELTEVRELIHELYRIGTDALIIQDMSLLEMDIPPIALYASTQTHNYSIDRIQFLESAGLERIILARELSLQQIQEIKQATKSELEFFVHGALCVSFSGQCYFSEATTGRSANRGECSQSCRLPYNLEDSTGKVMVQNKHLLSMKDLDLSHYLYELLEAGVTSFKIEGRLKDVNYVKNITAFYRQKLDAIIEANPEYARASSGTVHFTFTPDPERTFSRGYTDYFIRGEDEVGSIASLDTPKSLGKPVGEVIESGLHYISLKLYDKLVNGDGICYFDDHNDLRGMFINKMEGNKIITEGDPHVTPGSLIFRNNDLAFEQMLSRDKSERKIAVEMSVTVSGDAFLLAAVDEDGIRASVVFGKDAEPARQPEQMTGRLKQQLMKSGETVFTVSKVACDLTAMCFLTVAGMNELRREVLEQLTINRILKHPRPVRKLPDVTVQFPVDSLDYRGNVTNSLAKEFYKKHGVNQIDEGMELTDEYDGKAIMTTKYCIKKELDICPFDHPGEVREYVEPLYLRDNKKSYRLAFDCDKCQMRILY